MTAVRALVLSGFGLNCDTETAFALTLAGAEAERVHINQLVDGSVKLADYQLMAFIGGFSWGDDHGAGVIQAVRMRTRLGDTLQQFVADGNLVIGICNGFQVLVNLGLLPGFDGNYNDRQVALTYNDCGSFKDQWVHLTVAPSSPCVFTRGMTKLEFPIRHGEGKFVADPDVIERLTANGQVVLQYADSQGAPAGGRFPDNPNGSMADIAGICDTTGRVFGLMPHPEAYNHWTNHPDWPRRQAAAQRGGPALDTGMTPGIRLLKNGVDHLAAG